jgi:hypothetical protein
MAVLVKLLLVLGVSLATSAALGCATAYAPVHDLVGDGYRDSRLDSNTWRVAFAGNGATSRDTVEKYLLYRCAEITNAAGFDYFLVIETNTSVHTSHAPDIYQSMTMYDGAGNATTTGQYIPGASSRSHVARATIRAFKGAKPPGDPGAFVASEVLTYLGREIGGAKHGDSEPARSSPVEAPRAGPEKTGADSGAAPAATQETTWQQRVAAQEMEVAGARILIGMSKDEAITELTRLGVTWRRNAEAGTTELLRKEQDGNLRAVGWVALRNHSVCGVAKFWGLPGQTAVDAVSDLARAVASASGRSEQVSVKLKPMTRPVWTDDGFVLTYQSGRILTVAVDRSATPQLGNRIQIIEEFYTCGTGPLEDLGPEAPRTPTPPR